jgi:hypothetical protein
MGDHEMSLCDPSLACECRHALRAEIERCRPMTDKPFGANLTIRL